MKKIIILLAILLVLISVITYTTIANIPLGSIGTLSFNGISEKMRILKTEETKYLSNKTSFDSKETELTTITNEYNEEKEKYNRITDTTLNVVKEAIKDVDYSIEYMWIVLGNYAYDNGLTIKIEESSPSISNNNIPNTLPTPQKKDENTTNTSDENKENIDNTADTTSNTVTDVNSTDSNSMTTSANKILKLTVIGRYSDVADFVFEVENDRSLKFKLDNISMKYSTDNKITATFDIYGLTILK